MSQIRNKLLRDLFTEAEFDREHDEVKEIEAAVRHLVNEIAETIAEKEPLFNNTVLQSGSFYEDLKVEGPNEFDFMICLENLSQPDVCEVKEIPFRSVGDPGYVHVQVRDSDLRLSWQRYVSKKKQNLKPKTMLEKFQTLVNYALAEKREHFHEKLSKNFEAELRKIPVTLKLIWNGTKYTNYEISVDLVLCIRMAGWPNDSDVRERYNRSHPSYEMIRQATQEGYHLIASCIGESGKPRPCWRLSFSRAEGILLRHLSETSQLVHKAAVKILKVLRKKNESQLCLYEEEVDFSDPDVAFDYLGVPECSYLITWAFHSYILKTMFLHEWFEYPEDSYWTQEKLARRVYSVLERIFKSLSKKDIRSFWLPEYKLFNFRASYP
ncbi:Cyclic GMP-AMP synthase [Stylophora pistillata]|uniref:Cyclic GMP-AMP synthase n=1 Tax=Stylophora pistillata TaxID=50429 RepID=A0A2B4RBW5_STYPI|nr:Cyclic GMP-AMP synthase [Stylophora pistillata]